MKKKAFLALAILSLVASAAYATAVSCGPEQSSGSTPYDDEYTSSGPSCHTEQSTVFAYKDCIN
jgi:hypothetical protein